MSFRFFCILIYFCLLTFLSQGQDTAVLISSVDKELSSGRRTVSDVLCDSKLMYLHSVPSFREVIRRNSDTGAITIVSEAEPGVRIIVNGTVENSSGEPLANIMIYFYHTSDKGWYSDTSIHINKYEGDHRHSRLFGYVKTDSKGKFTIKTIRPNGYPQSDFAGHIHIQMWHEDGRYLLGVAGELQFSDDVRMTQQRRLRSLAEGFLIAENVGTTEMPEYNYIIRSKR